MSQSYAIPQHFPAHRRMMAFVDGENLVRRFEETLKSGLKPRTDSFVHVPGSLVWHATFTHLAQVGFNEVLRVTYYTSLVGSDPQLEALRDQIKTQSFQAGQGSLLPNWVTPEVFKRDKGTQRSKGVDIKLCVDALTQVHGDTLDTVLLLSGDGDYLPLVREARRAGKQVYISAFISGLSPALKHEADEFYALDGTTFAP